MGFFSFHARLCSLVIILCLSLDFVSATDTITSSQFIKDPATLSSNGNFFTLGFFSPGNSTNRYVGIWYMSESSIVWVANRNQPLNGSSSIVTISDDGNLVVQNEQKKIIWSSNVSDIASNTTCRLLDSGNLVLLDNNGGKIIWQSFEHPSEAYLKEDILRCIHIGLLCVQDLARERPSMSTIISMLNSEIVNLPNPRQPAFIQWQSIFSSMPHGQSHGLFSNNNVSITEINGR